MLSERWREQFMNNCSKFFQDAGTGKQARHLAFPQDPANRHGSVFFHNGLS